MLLSFMTERTLLNNFVGKKNLPSIGDLLAIFDSVHFKISINFYSKLSCLSLIAATIAVQLT